ncbi:MAG: desulfoferrodoxin [Oscillospiraceae bacterium]|nr:desulfoferrodoxin [Oscillospiraceae bacterium]
MYPKFFKCMRCGNIAVKVHDSGVPMVCCGEKMTELEPNTVEASGEKHLPVVTLDGDLVKVNVGSADHPMIPEHYIEFIYLYTEKGGQIAWLKAGDKPYAEFAISEGDKPLAAFAYCNLHGLWKTDIG